MKTTTRSDGSVEVTTKAFRVLGSTDDVTECELCGRTDLKGTIVLQPLATDGSEDGEPVYYGSDCGARAAKWTVKEIRSAAREADRKAEEARQAEKRAKFEAEFAVWSAFVAERSGIAAGAPDALFRGIQALGGFKAASDAFNAREVA